MRKIWEERCMNYDAVIFDFDYTLGDATEAIYAGFVHGLTTMGYPKPDLEAVRGTIGMVVTEAYALLTGDHRPEEGQRFYSLFHPMARDLQAKGAVKLFPGASELLKALKEQGAKTAIVSTKNMDSLHAILGNTGIGDLVDQVVGGGMGLPSKPDPQGTLLALEKLGVDRTRALYCGDTVIDAQTARNAGVDFCAVLNGTTPAGDFGVYPHVHIAPDLAELKSWLGI